MRYIFQLRRGWKYDSDPETGLPRDDWAKYTEEKPEEAIPLAGELVLEYDNGIPRLKIGNGKDTFSELPYMSVDSFILPKPTTISLYGGEKTDDNPNGWSKEYDDDGNLIGYMQVVNVTNYNITPNSKVDIQPDPKQLAIFHEKDVAFTAVTETIDGETTVTVHAVGTMPQQDYENIQVTVTEVALNAEVDADE